MNLLFDGQILENLTYQNSKHKSKSNTVVMILDEDNRLRKCFYVYEKIDKNIDSQDKRIQKCLIQKDHTFLKILDFIYKVWDLQTNQGIFHGDLKRENIMIDADENDIKIIDFVFSKFLDPAKSYFYIKGYTEYNSTFKHIECFDQRE